MFRLMHKNKKGFSLVELIITVVILGLVMSIAGQILNQLTRVYNQSELRWEIQTAVKLACDKFEINRDALSNAYQADVLYDPVVEEGIIYDKDSGTFTWKNGQPKSYVMPEEGAVDLDNPYTYMYSTPAYSPEGEYLGYYMFLRIYDSQNSILYLDEAGFGETPVQIDFSIAKSADALDADGNADTDIPDKYLTHTIGINMKSGREDIVNYQLKTAYTLVNISEGKEINYSGGALVFEPEWLNGSTPAAGPAGWTDEELNSEDKSAAGFPSTNNTSYYDNSGKKQTVAVTTLTEHGNVMRFISPTAFHEKSNTDQMTGSAHMASCLTAYAFSEPTKEASRVLGGLRDFRDNVLAGTTVGDWIIDNYYNEWSPFLIEKAGFLKPVYRAVLKPLSFVCGLAANT